MIKCPFAVAVAIFALSSLATRGEGFPESLPREKLIRSLITLDEQIKSDQIEVAIVLPGELTCESGFVCRQAARVILVMPMIENGRKVRRVAERIFLWNEQWGWFTYREVQRRGGEAILVFSEKAGLAEFR